MTNMWQNLYFKAEFGRSMKVDMKAASACNAVITRLKNLSELIGLPKLTKENGNLFNVGLNLSRQIPMKDHP